METTETRYTVTNWIVGFAVFAVFGVVVLYVFLLTQPTGFTVFEWSLILLCVVGTTQLALAALKRRRRYRS